MKKILLTLSLFIVTSIYPNPEKPPISTLVGDWSTPCHKKKNTYVRFANDGTGIFSKNRYQTSLCLFRKKHRIVFFTYQIGKAINKKEAIWELDITSTEQVKYENYIKKKEWDINTKAYNIFQIDENNNLHFGVGEGDTKEERPTKIRVFTGNKLLTKVTTK